MSHREQDKEIEEAKVQLDKELLINLSENR